MKSKRTFKSFLLIAIVLSYVLVICAGSTVVCSGSRDFPSGLTSVKGGEIELARNGIQIGRALSQRS